MAMYNRKAGEIKVVPAYTVAEAARLLGVTVQSVYRWRRSGRLEAIEIAGGNAKLVSAASVERLRKERGRAA